MAPKSTGKAKATSTTQTPAQVAAQAGVAPNVGSYTGTAAPGGAAAGTSTGVATEQTKQGKITLVNPVQTQAEKVAELPPDLAQSIISVNTSPGEIPGLQASRGRSQRHRGYVNDALDTKALLTAYNHIFTGVGVSGEDLKQLQGLGDKRITKFVDYLYRGGANAADLGDTTTEKETRTVRGLRSAVGRSAVSVPVTGTFITGTKTSKSLTPREFFKNVTTQAQQVGGTPLPPRARAQDMASVYGFANARDAQAAIAQAVAKKIPGLSPESLSDPKNVLQLQVPQQLMTKWGSVSSALHSGMTFRDLYDAKDPQTNDLVISPPEEQVIGERLKSTDAKIKLGSQTGEEAYQNLLKMYDNGGNDQQTLLGTLEAAGLLNVGAGNATPTKAATSQALVQAITGAKVANQSINAYLAYRVQTIANENGGAANVAAEGPGAAYVAQAAATLGVDLSDAQRKTLMDEAVRGSWDADQATMAVAGAYTYDPSKPLKGRAASIWAGMQTLQQEYMPGMQLSQGTLGNWLTQAIRGVGGASAADAAGDAAGDPTGTSAALAGFKQYIQQQAAGRFPEFAQQIGEGINTQTLIDPYAQMAASLLGYGQNPNGLGTASQNATNDATASLGINWDDPKWKRLITGGNGGKPMTLDEARNTIIQDPQYGWQNTDMAQNLATHVSDSLLETFGYYKAGGTLSALG